MIRLFSILTGQHNSRVKREKNEEEKVRSLRGLNCYAVINTHDTIKKVRHEDLNAGVEVTICPARDELDPLKRYGLANDHLAVVLFLMATFHSTNRDTDQNRKSSPSFNLHALSWLFWLVQDHHVLAVIWLLDHLLRTLLGHSCQLWLGKISRHYLHFLELQPQSLSKYEKDGRRPALFYPL